MWTVFRVPNVDIDANDYLFVSKYFNSIKSVTVLPRTPPLFFRYDVLVVTVAQLFLAQVPHLFVSNPSYSIVVSVKEPCSWQCL